VVVSTLQAPDDQVLGTVPLDDLGQAVGQGGSLAGPILWSEYLTDALGLPSNPADVLPAHAEIRQQRSGVLLGPGRQALGSTLRPYRPARASGRCSSPSSSSAA
jgi:hypothetical protein